MTTLQQKADHFAEMVGRRLRDIREAAGLTQQQTADRLTEAGYPAHRLHVSNSEQAKRPVSLQDLFAFARVFGVPVSYFLSEPDDAQTTALDNEQLVVASADVFLEELQATITAERARLAKHSAHLSARRAALGG